MFYFGLRLMILPVGEQMSASAPMSELPCEHCGRLMFIRWTRLYADVLILLFSHVSDVHACCLHAGGVCGRQHLLFLSYCLWIPFVLVVVSWRVNLDDSALMSDLLCECVL